MKTNLAITTVLAVRELEDTEEYTTGTSAMMRFPSGHAEQIRVRRNIESMLRYRKVERFGDLRGRPTYTGADIKEVLFHEGGQWLSQIADRLLKTLWSLHHQAADREPLPEPEYQKLFRKLKRAKGLDDILNAVGTESDNPTAGLLGRLCRHDIRRLLFDFGEIEADPLAIAEPDPVIYAAPVAHVLDEGMVTQPLLVDHFPLAEAEPPPARLIRMPRKKLSRLLAVAACLFCFLGAWAAVETLGRGRVILESKGIGAALRYVAETRLDLSDGYKDRRDAAFIFHKAAHYDRARTVVRQLLADPNTPKKIQGDCYYMLGLINSDTGDLVGAESAYRQADRLYEKPASKNAIALALGNVAWLSGDLEEARKQADLAAEYHLQSQNKGNITAELILRGAIALSEGNYEKALELSNRRYAQAPNQKEQANAAVDLGFIYALRGDFAMAVEQTMQAKTLIDLQEDEVLGVYNSINYVAICTRQGAQPPQSALERIDSFLAVNRNPRMSWYYKLARQQANY